MSLSFTQSFQQLLAALPLWPLIAVQSYLIAVEVLLWLFHQDGRVPVQMTFEGRNLDMLVGVSAPFVAMAACPLVWLPAFVAPTALCLHLLSIRQSLQPRSGSAEQAVDVVNHPLRSSGAC